ncbi:septation ring formation regulator EzrA [Niallia sp. NCCP-28]|uniref:septation ring formation regulator EzrA n=1 Tax=Niallia sp. NCCP-28 TaxID=2934712 RepID=UPI00208BC3B8|nr:septation ring formation regulator EzrA [Niallia sp. NCCP-28]GKU81580.1 septation ring formation regulator EzrA [Niallia sp. NCCP-28]
MDYIIGGVVIIICLFLSGYLIKRKYYGLVDELENRKMTIMNRPVLEELSKVKQLNMIGQTEELFERWRSEWDDIVTVQLPEVEEMLLDTEEFIDKYKLHKVKKNQNKIHLKLEQIEKSIEKMLQELENLVGSEEKNRTEIEGLKETYRESKKTLLAHRYTFGETEPKLEAMLKEVVSLLNDYEENTKNGNYLDARKIVQQIEEKLAYIRFLVEAIPPILMECKTKLPESISELKEGYKAMLEQGFILEHIQLEAEVEEIEKELKLCSELLQNGEVERIQSILAEVQEKLDLLYDLLEKEAIAKNYSTKNLDVVKGILAAIGGANERLQEEVSLLQRSYHIDNEDLELQFKLETKLKHLFKQYEVLEHKLMHETAAHTVLTEELKLLKEQMETVAQEQQVLFDKFYALRKDEVLARQKMKELSKEIANSIRVVANSNLPGVTKEYSSLIDEAKESIEKLKSILNEAPLDIPAVHTLIGQAESNVAALVEATDKLVETVMLAEKIIQYGNRYRRKYTKVEKSLSQAEASFRHYKYSDALSQAAAAIEEVEPGSIKRMEAIVLEEKEKENQYN